MPDAQGILLPGDEGYVAPAEQPNDTPPSQQANTEPPAPVEGDNLPLNQEPPAQRDGDGSPVNQEPPVIDVPENTIVDPEKPVDTETNEPLIENENGATSSLDLDSIPEYVGAKEKFSELYPKWNAMSDEEQQSEDGKSLSAELSRLHAIIVSYEMPGTTIQNGGDNPNPPKDMGDEHFTSNPETETTDPNDADLVGEQTIDKAGRPAGYNPFYHGDAVVHDENAIIYQMPSDEFYANKNKENR